MNHDVIGCYGPEMNTLADLVGDFDAASPADTDRWVRAQWHRLAAMLGWEARLEVSGAGDSAALDAFTQWLSRRQAERPQRGTIPERYRDERARLQVESLDRIQRIAMATYNLWRPNIPSRELPENGCFGPEGEAAEIDTTARMLRDMTRRKPQPRQYRVFRADVAPSYYDKRHPHRPAGCDYPVVLSLGTYPWVYGGVLGHNPPGLSWRASGSIQPARTAMKIAASFWRPAGNFMQDARFVAAQYKHFRDTTARALLHHPQPRPRMHAGLMRPVRKVPTQERVFGPRGVFTVASFNVIKLRFAAFFAARRAYARAFASLPAQARDLLARNPDPCIQVVRKAV